MPLPKCVKVDFYDHASAQALREEGWREIGVLDQWSGKIIGAERGAKRGQDRGWAAGRIEEFGFTGRLWRDPEIPRFTAMAETRGLILGVEDLQFFAINSDGFAIVTRQGETLRLNLVGVLKKGSGIAQDLINSAVSALGTTWFRAGTYSDNLAARRLYEVMGLERKYSELVFHK